MIDKIADFFWRIAGWKTFIAALALYVVVYTCVILKGLTTLQQMSGKKIEILDLQFSYTPEKAKTIIGAYGDTARAFASKFELIGDTLYPISYTFLFLIIMSGVFKALSAYDVRLKYIHLLPFAVMTADYCENAGIITMLKTYPGFSDNLVTVTSAFTSLKWSLFLLQTIIIGIALWMLTFYSMTRRKVVSK